MGDPKQIHLNVAGKGTHLYDAIVIGSGISGGWAAKELSQRGLKTLMIERGRNVDHIKDYPTANKNPWDFSHFLKNTLRQKVDNPIQSYASNEADRHFYVKDQDHPYIQADPFNWIRGYQLGGRSLTWGRQCYRLSDLDFEANRREGVGVDWPIRYKDLEPWYDYVENFIGVSGRREGLHQLPDGCFLPPMEMNCIESHFTEAIRSRYPERAVTIARIANLTTQWDGRGPCQLRNLCTRGCPFGGYFSTNASTLPAARNSGNLTLLTDTIVHQILLDSNGKRAQGVQVIDANTHQVTEYYSRIIFLNASTIASACILLQSVSKDHPHGLGNGSGQVGRNLMDHFVGSGAQGIHDEYGDQYYAGRRPCGIYIPRFRNLDGGQSAGFARGYGLQGMGTRWEWEDENRIAALPGFGKNFKDQVFRPGPWALWLGAWGEVLPNPENKVVLSATQSDRWGLPLAELHYKVDDNEVRMRKDAVASAEEMLHEAGFHQIQTYSHLAPGGGAVHEMGTMRMGHDPKDSVLNKYNQMHEVPNVFVTDGSCMTSSASQNPSLTYMALTARASAYAVEEIKKGNL